MYKDIYISKNDYENIMFNGLSVRLGNYTLNYPADFVLDTELKQMPWVLHDNSGRTPILTSAELVEGSKIKKEEWRTFEEQFRFAMNDLEKRFASTYGSFVKLCYDNDPALTGVMMDLQDALWEAVETDFDDEEDIFGYFIGTQDYIWWANIVGVDKAIALCREFFDKYYPQCAAKRNEA